MAEPTLNSKVALDESVISFCFKIAQKLGLHAHCNDQPYVTITDDEVEDSEANGSAGEGKAVCVTIRNANDLHHLWSLQRETGAGAIEAEPIGDPQTVSDIAAFVLQPYNVRRGHAFLAGCVFDPQAFLQLQVLNTPAGAETSIIEDYWFDRDGCQVDPTLRQQLHLEYEEVISGTRLRRTDRDTVTNWIDAASSQLQDAQCVGVSVVWCRFVMGKVRIQFDSGKSTLIAFDGWARLWSDGEIRSPKFKCPTTGLESYEIVCLDDGTITVSEAVGICEQSGIEVMRSELKRCSVTKKLARRSLMTMCPIANSLLLIDHAVECQWCQRLVSEQLIENGRCESCCHLAPIGSLDERVVGLKDSVPNLGGMVRWSGWSDGQHVLLVGKRLLREELFLIRREGYRIIRRGLRRRWSGRWHFEDTQDA